MSYVQVIFPSGIASQFRGDFINAANFWNDAITSGAAPLTFGSNFNAAGLCGVNFTFRRGDTIRGVAIFAQVQFIDGPGSILGSAGPCGLSGRFARLGVMNFDSADAGNLDAQGQFEEVVRHEMAHVLGIGTLWSREGLVLRPCPGTPCNTNPVYIGSQGTTGFGQLGGSGNPPVANTGGGGTINGHWRESTFQNELMTGFLSPGTNPASVMTIRSFRDMGFGTDLGASEPYSLPRPGDVANVGEVELYADVLEFEAGDLDAILAEADADVGSAQEFSELTVVLGVFVAVFAMISMMLAFVVVRRSKSNALPVQKTEENEEVKAASL